MTKRSLFVLSLPRSLSTRVFHAVRGALSLQQPIWTTDGEIMNNDRFVLYAGPAVDESLKFTREEDVMRYQRAGAFLKNVTMVEGFAYKDVVQPFVVSAWLRTQSLPVLKIRRRIEDVAYAMIARRWFYPARSFPHGNLINSMLHGLSRTWSAIETVPGEVVDFDDLITSEESLRDAVRSLYPDEDLQLPTIRDPRFEQTRGEVLKRRETPIYRELMLYARELGLSS